MFYKIFTFLLIFICGHFFEEVFGNILLIDPEKVILDNDKKESGHHTISMWITEKDFSSLSKEEVIVNNKYDPCDYCLDFACTTETYCLKTQKKYVMCGPLILDIENKNEIFAELYVNFYAYIYENIKKKDTIYIKITFEEKHIILNYNGKDYIFEYNVEGIDLKLESFMFEINKGIRFKIIKIQTSKLDNNTSLINDTVYAKHTRIQLRNLENLSLWKYVKEELIQSNSSTLPNTAINDFILNSTMYKSDIKYTLEKSRRIMCDRTFKYAILLMVYAYEALRIDYCTRPYWDQLIYKLKKLSDARINLDENKNLQFGLKDIKHAINECDVMCIFQRLVNDYATIFLTPQEMKIFKFKDKYSFKNIKDEQILSQHLLHKILIGFPKHHSNDESYQFELIPPYLCEIEEKLQQIFKLIDAEFENIYKIDL
ncbi:uncharacterized protein LOC126906965 [Daktulosphaira vitifoliae]|uniref:uncharacterized protein LOC126906965 n=1 Tax=Daktulosphaira vitifoliae TaxID=58002 RepID=UPI0021AAAB22|nr:uncharacterized protein LOC126906965 [Daktulosphaira vitifoliae]